MGQFEEFHLTTPPSLSAGFEEEMNIIAEQFAPDLREILIRPPSSLDHPIDLTRPLTRLTCVFLLNVSYSLFCKAVPR